jgi:hypothetical protein
MHSEIVRKARTPLTGRAYRTTVQIMNILSCFKPKPETVTACTARQDGGYLVRLSSGRHGASAARLTVGTPAILRRSGAVEVVR